MKRWLWVVLAVAAGLRLGHWWMVADFPFVSTLALDAQEYDRLARQLAAGDWWGGDAFYMAPLYIYVVAVAYAVFGATPHVVYGLQILAGLSGMFALYLLGSRLRGERLGVIAAALFGGSWVLVLYDVLLAKDGLAAVVTAWMFLAIDLGRGVGAKWRWWVVTGVLAGALALLRENALLLFPLIALMVIGERRGKAAIGSMVVFGLGLGLVIGPVALRNAVTSGYPLPSSYAGGTNLWVGNNPDADGMWRPILPARQSPEVEQRALTRIAEDAVGHELAPAEVSSWWRSRVVSWALADPGAFLALQVRKVWLAIHPYEFPDTLDPYWFRERSPFLQLALVERGALLLLGLWGALMVWREPRWRPLVVWVPAWILAIAVFFVFARYRLPLIPVLCLLAAVPIDRAWADLEAGDRRRGRLALLATLLVLLVFRALPFRAQEGLVEYNLGRLAEESGDLKGAEDHYRAARDFDPQDFVMAMNLGTVLARSGRLPEALPVLEEAVRLAPGSAEAAANLASALLATGSAGSADAEARRALVLDPHYLPALVTGSLAAIAAGDLDYAETLILRVAELEPEHPAIDRLRRRLETAQAGGTR